MKTREANNDDIEKITHLVKEGLQDFGFTYAPKTSEADLMDIQSEYFKEGGTFLILEDDQQQLCAIGALKKLSPGIFKIRKMYVAHKYRGKGYGERILLKLIQEARYKNAKQIILETSHKMKAAINLYQKHGFEEVDLQSESPRCDMTLMKSMSQ